MRSGKPSSLPRHPPCQYNSYSRQAPMFYSGSLRTEGPTGKRWEELCKFLPSVYHPSSSRDGAPGVPDAWLSSLSQLLAAEEIEIHLHQRPSRIPFLLLSQQALNQAATCSPQRPAKQPAHYPSIENHESETKNGWLRGCGLWEEVVGHVASHCSLFILLPDGEIGSQMPASRCF